MIIGSLNEELDGNAATTKRDPTPAASRATAEAPAPSLPAPLYQTTQARSEWSLAQSNYAPGQSSEWSAPPSSYGPPRLFRGTQPPYTPLSLSMFSTGAPGPPPSSLPGYIPQPQAHTDDPLRQRYSGGSPTSHAPTSYTVSSGSFAAAVPPSAPLSGNALSREPTWGTMGSLQHPMTMDPRNYNQHHSSQYPRYGAQGPQWPQNPER
ncbi:hypothetical protein GQ53DRAFT_93347 [Thozetella sp. PMI_491]|nr:hypothetical protein GQ53DRAFT_93347 [Thozetella sp. PMI_491]